MISFDSLPGNINSVANDPPSSSRSLRSRRYKMRKESKDTTSSSSSSNGAEATIVAENRVIIVEKNQYHAMAAAPTYLGWPGYAVVFESSGHVHNPAKNSKVCFSIISCVFNLYIAI